jgi:hypothetical protein
MYLIQFYYHSVYKMGNVLGNANTKQMDVDAFIANEILTLPSDELKKFNNVAECNKWVNVVKGTIENTLSQVELKSILGHIRQGNGVPHDGDIGKLANFFTKIAHVYAAIKPIIETQNVNETICGSRMKSLIHGAPNISESHKPDRSNKGITDLDQLYMDSHYDLKTNTFKGRSSVMNKKHAADLATFYMSFTGNTKMDHNVKSFSDINVNMHNYKLDTDPACDEDCLFKKYALNISKNLAFINDSHTKLMDILNEIFVKEKSNANTHTINPALTDVILSELVVSARTIIMGLYITCERAYTNGVNMYEAILNKTMLETLKNQQIELKKHLWTIRKS